MAVHCPEAQLVDPAVEARFAAVYALGTFIYSYSDRSILYLQSPSYYYRQSGRKDHKVANLAYMACHCPWVTAKFIMGVLMLLE